MIRRLRSTNLREIDFVPQTVIGQPPTYFEKDLQIELTCENDELDEYRGASFILNDKTPFSIRITKDTLPTR